MMLYVRGMSTPAGTTKRIRLRRPGATIGGTMHVIEVLDYHVNGWKMTRCLTHGQHGPTPDKGDDVQTAIVAAKECARVRRLPYYRDQPLGPALPAHRKTKD